MGLTKYSRIQHAIMNVFTLVFVDKKIEKEFEDFFIRKYINHLRFCMILSIVFYSISSFLDILFLNEYYTGWFWRYISVLVLFIIGLLISYTLKGFYYKYWKLLNLFFVLATAWGFLLASAVAPEPVNFLLYYGVLISMVFNYTFIRQPFLYATLGGWILFGSYIFHSLIFGIPRQYFIFGLAYIGIMNILGMFISYYIESESRRSFILSRNLIIESENVETANRDLERKVSERTSELNNALDERIKTEEQLKSYKDHLKELVKTRTSELETKNNELEESNKLFVGQEIRMKQMKEEIKKLKKELDVLKKGVSV
jgi:hypothetical protein